MSSFFARVRLPELFLLFGFVLGSIYAVTTPPLQVPDESGHFFRAYTVSTGHCQSPPKITVPVMMFLVQHTYPARVQTIRRIQPGEFYVLNRRVNNEAIPFDLDNSAANLYTCVPYIPAAVAIRASLITGQSAILTMYVARFTNLAVFLVLTWLALRLLPGFQWLLFCLALMPMTLHQAASLSADALGIGAGFLWCAYVLHLAFTPQTITRRQTAALLLLALFLCLCKFNIWLVLFLLLIPAERFGSRRQRLVAVLACTFLPILLVAVWQQINRENLEAVTYFRTQRGLAVQTNAQFLIHHPILFVRMALNTVVLDAPRIAGEFVGAFGWLAVKLPGWVTALYLALLLSAAMLETAPLRFTWRQRVGFAAIFCASLLSLLWLMYTLETLTSTEAADLAHPSQAKIINLQGRYLIHFIFPLLLALSAGAVRLPRRAFAAVALTFIPIATAAAVHSMHQTFDAPLAEVIGLDRQGHLPFGYIDYPPSGVRITGPLRLYGWVLCEEPVKSVKIYLDGSPVGEATLHVGRPDVTSAYRFMLQSENSGWWALLDLTRFPPGPHILSAQAFTFNGSSRLIGTRSVIVDP